MSLATETTRLDDNMEAVIQTCVDFKTTYQSNGLPIHTYTKTNQGNIIETSTDLPFNNYPQAITDYLSVNSLPYFRGQTQYILYRKQDSGTGPDAQGWAKIQNKQWLSPYFNAQIEYAKGLVGIRIFGISNQGNPIENQKRVSPAYGVSYIAGLDDILLFFATTDRPLDTIGWSSVYLFCNNTNSRWDSTSILHNTSTSAAKLMIDGYIDCFFDINTAMGTGNTFNEIYGELQKQQNIYFCVSDIYRAEDGTGNEYYLKHPIPFCFLYDKSCLSINSNN